MRTEIGSSRGASSGLGLDNSGFCIRFRPTPKATSTSPIAATDESRCLTATGTLIRTIQIGVPFDYARAHPAIGPKPGAPDGSLASYGAALTMAPGAPWALCITPPPNQVLYSSDAFPGRIYKMTLDGKVLGVLGETGKKLKQFGWIHEIACPSENELYVAELLNWRVQKLILHPESK